MLEPNGPLPPEIYWRRRLLAIGVIAAAIVLVVGAGILLTGGDDHKATPAAATSTAPVSSSAGVTPTGAADSGAPSASAAASASAVSANVACPDQSLAVKVTVGQPSYKVGDQPVFNIVITNISTQACQRDMGSGLQQVIVQSLDGQRRLWSNTDCDKGAPADVRALTGGQQAAFTLTWSGTSSQPNCAGDRVQVPAGPYAVVAQFGSLRSNPEPFNLL
ncbi:hypothetical protein [Nocardia stercoris]|uniref:DUF4232 domain-containing protein n=1 Tax=Nocardia stercoris TaxID=2483361 RepID=A0A3M2KW54_9NOCA|nr:hypothetical protein [Nocardia stercoris]RMI29244.1 hypothetical protein EBN03_26200 [Nocardia stercoris]